MMNLWRRWRRRLTKAKRRRLRDEVFMAQVRHEAFMAKLHADWFTCLGCGLRYQRSIYPKGCPNYYRGGNRSEVRHSLAAERLKAYNRTTSPGR